MRSTTLGARVADLPLAPHFSLPAASARPALPSVRVRQSSGRIAAIAARALGAAGALLSLDDVCVERHEQLAGYAAGADDDEALRLLTAHVLGNGLPLVVPDLRLLPQSEECAAELGIIAYAAVPLIALDGSVLGVLAAFATAPRAWTAADVDLLTDLARLAAAELALAGRGLDTIARDRARHLALLDVGAAGVVEIDLDGRCTLVNATADGMLGYGDMLYGRDVHLFLHTRWDGSSQHDLDLCPVSTVLRAGLRLGPEETVLQSSDGSRFYAEYAAAPIIEDGRINGALLWFRDLTPRKQLEERLAQQAQNDALTGLANRAAFADRLQEALAHAAREDGTVAVLMLDVDDFSGVNQHFGNGAGDRLLVEIGRRLSTCVRHGDLVARSGGDEFAVLLERVSGLAETQRVSERLLAGLRPPFPLAGGTVQVGASMGIAIVDGHCAGDDLLRAAAAALVEAKCSNKGGAVIAETGAALLLD
jgi:diguanylate cyclase (GGDEF)-like protein/PAS domain S-box-containing protein